MAATVKQNPSSETAGEKMIINVPVAKPDQTVSEVEKVVTEQTKKFETISYIYITDNENKLIGVISIKELFGALKTAKIGDIMQKNLVKAHGRTHQERVALLAIKYNLKAIPVVDKDDRFLGIVPSDTILNILHKKHVEDFLRSAGIHTFKDPIKYIIAGSATTHFKKRIPWLIVGLLGGIIAAIIVGSFENTLTQMIILASFIPAVVYIADAAGSQTQTIFIRNLALDPDLNFKKYIWRETKAGLLLAMTLSVIVSLVVFLIWQNHIVATILGFSFLSTIIIAMTVALFLPWFFLKISIDPAIASGPFATVIRDITSIIIYFGVASLIFKFF